MDIPTTYISRLMSGKGYSGAYKSYHKNKEALDTFAERIEKAAEKRDRYEPDRLSNTSPSIPDSLIRSWAEKYDPKNMTQEEYQAFIDDLISVGVLEESDKFYIRYDPNIVIVTPEDCGCFEVTPTYLEYKPDGYFFTLAQAGGNALRWTEGWKNYYGEINSNTSDTMCKILSRFDKIASILGQMEDAK